MQQMISVSNNGREESIYHCPENSDSYDNSDGTDGTRTPKPVKNQIKISKASKRSEPEPASNDVIKQKGRGDGSRQNAVRCGSAVRI